jgi:hypothetical protein
VSGGHLVVFDGAHRQAAVESITKPSDAINAGLVVREVRHDVPKCFELSLENYLTDRIAKVSHVLFMKRSTAALQIHLKLTL